MIHFSEVPCCTSCMMVSCVSHRFCGLVFFFFSRLGFCTTLKTVCPAYAILPQATRWMSSSTGGEKDPMDEHAKNAKPDDDVEMSMSSEAMGADQSLAGEAGEGMTAKPKPEILKSEKVVGEEEGHSFKAETMYVCINRTVFCCVYVLFLPENQLS